MGASSLFGAPGIGPDMLRISEDVVPRQHPVVTWGRNTALPNGSLGDVWAGPSDTWVAPLAARIHDIVSSSADDVNAGAGAHNVEIFGLKTWASVETSEVVTLNGITPVPTVESYVIIHRMVVRLWGANGPNVGTIKATAQTDGTVTAQVVVAAGQSEMSIVGVPSTQKLYVITYRASFLKTGGATGRVDVCLFENSIPDVQTVPFVERHNHSLNSEATSNAPVHFAPFMEIEGPAVVKVSCLADGANFDVSAGIEGVLVDNS